MIKMKDREQRLQLIRKYLDAETSIEEEELLLNYYLHADDTLSPEEEEVRALIVSTTYHGKSDLLSSDKEDQFDMLMAPKAPSPKSVRHLRPIRFLWPASIAAAAVLAVFLLPKGAKVSPTGEHEARHIATITSRPTPETTTYPSLPTEDPKICHKEVEEDLAASQRQTLLVLNEQEQESIPADIETPEVELPETETRTIVASNDPSTPSTMITSDSWMRLFVASSENGLHQASNRPLVVANNEGKDGVIKYLTEKKDDAIIYKIDGKIVSRDVFNRLDSDDIKEIKLLKRGSAAAIKEAPTQGRLCDIILVETWLQSTRSKEQTLAPRRLMPLPQQISIGDGTCML